MEIDLAKKRNSGKAEQNKKAKKEALTSAAFDLFTSKGINKTSIADIAERAKVAKGTFYLYFSDKYDIRNFLIANKAGAIFHKASAAMNARTSSVKTFEDKILFLASNIIDQFIEDPTIVRFLSKNPSAGASSSTTLNAVPAENGVDFRKPSYRRPCPVRRPVPRTRSHALPHHRTRELSQLQRKPLPRTLLHAGPLTIPA